MLFTIDIIDWRYCWRYCLLAILLTGDILLGDILLAILLTGDIAGDIIYWRYFAGNISSVHRFLHLLIKGNVNTVYVK